MVYTGLNNDSFVVSKYIEDGFNLLEALTGIEVKNNYEIILHGSDEDFLKHNTDYTKEYIDKFKIIVRIKDEKVHTIKKFDNIDIYSKILLYYILKNELKNIGLDNFLIEGLSTYIFKNNNSNYEDYNKFKVWYLDKIVRRDKKVLKSNELTDPDDYKNYSFLIVFYLLNTTNREKFITNMQEYKLTDDLINETIRYFNKFFEVDKIKSDITEVDSPEELLWFMCKNMVYGYVTETGEERLDLKTMHDDYKTNSVNTTINHMVGTCLEQTNFEKCWFDRNGIENKVFVWRYYKNDENYKMHAFLIYYQDESYYLFERSNQMYAGIYEYNTLDDALNALISRYDKNDRRDLIELKEFSEGLTFKEFNRHLDKLKKYSYKR